MGVSVCVSGQAVINLCMGGVGRSVMGCVSITYVSTFLCRGFCRRNERSGCVIFSCVFFCVNVFGRKKNRPSWRQALIRKRR